MATLTRPTPKRKSQRSGRSIVAIVAIYAALVILALIFLLPFYLIVRASLSSEADLTSPHWTFFSDDAALEQFQGALHRYPDENRAEKLGDHRHRPDARPDRIGVNGAAMAWPGFPTTTPTRSSMHRGHPDDPGCGHVHSQLRARLLVGLGVDPARLIVPGLFSGFAASCSGSIFWASLRSWRRPAGSTG